MAKFLVSAAVTIGIYAHVEADNKEDAKEIARDLCMPDLCAYCSSDKDEEQCEWSLYSIDGEPMDIEAEQADGE